MEKGVLRVNIETYWGSNPVAGVSALLRKLYATRLQGQ